MQLIIHNKYIQQNHTVTMQDNDTLVMDINPISKHPYSKQIDIHNARNWCLEIILKINGNAIRHSFTVKSENMSSTITDQQNVYWHYAIWVTLLPVNVLVM